MRIIVVDSSMSSERFRLEYNLTGEWEPERGFPSCNSAETYAKEHLSSNEWRIWDIHDDKIVAYQSAISGMGAELKMELTRFEATVRARNYYQQRRSAPRPSFFERADKPKKKKNFIEKVVNWLKEGF